MLVLWYTRYITLGKCDCLLAAHLLAHKVPVLWKIAVPSNMCLSIGFADFGEEAANVLSAYA